MKRWSWLLLAALAAAPAIADDKKKDDKKAKDAPVAQAPRAGPVKDAEAKLAAGDADGAVAALEKAMGGDPKAALRLGQIASRAASSTSRWTPTGRRPTGSREPPRRGARPHGSGAGHPRHVRCPPRTRRRHSPPTPRAVADDRDGLPPGARGQGRRPIALAQKAAATGGGAAATAASPTPRRRRGDLAAAEASYKQAIAADPVALGPIVGLATVLRKTGRAAEAEPLLKKVIDASPGPSRPTRRSRGQDRARPLPGGARRRQPRRRDG